MWWLKWIQTVVKSSATWNRVFQKEAFSIFLVSLAWHKCSTFNMVEENPLLWANGTYQPISLISVFPEWYASLHNIITHINSNPKYMWDNVKSISSSCLKQSKLINWLTDPCLNLNLDLFSLVVRTHVFLWLGEHPFTAHLWT